MGTRYIYLNDELNNKLKTESNASALICSLLTAHYREVNLKEASKEDLDLKKNQIEKSKREASQAFELQEKEIETIMKTKEEKEAEEEKIKEQKLALIKVKQFVMDMTPKQEKEYRNGKWKSYKDYAEEKLNGK